MNWHSRKENSPLCGLLAAAVLAVALAGCSADMTVFKTDWTVSSSGSAAAAMAASDGLVGPGGICPEGPVPRGVALGMSECELVRLAGPTERIEIGANERGDRTAVVIYPSGERAGIYRFSSGLLVSIERVAEPAPQKPQRRTRQPQRS
jgi:hypothetical protein